MTNYELPQMKYSKQKGLVSVIVPIYNTNETYLKECLDSILSQTFINWEAILVNDGSTDNTGKILDEYVKKDSRFIVINKQNQGTLLARKTGLENSKGEFIASIDSDDILNSQFLEKMYSKITETNADFVWCKTQEDCNSFCIIDYKWNVDVSKNMESMITNIGATCVTWNKLIKRENYANILFPNIHLTIGEDPVQMLQVAYHSKSTAFVSENLYFYRNGGVTTHVNFTNAIQSIISINEIFEILFNGIIPKNVKKAFYCFMGDYAKYYFFFLSKKEKQIFKDKFKPLLPGFIKYEKELYLKICLFLASKEIEFPIVLLKWIKNKKVDKLKKLCKLYEPIYIYGIGVWSERAVNFFEKEKINIKGFIVSDGFKKADKFKDKNIYEISQIKPNNKQIVVLALNDNNKKQVIPNLKKAKIRFLEF